MLAIGVSEMWGKRDSWFGRGGLTVMILGTGVWSWVILGRNADWFPALRWTILAVTVIASAGLVVSTRSNTRQRLAIASLLVGWSVEYSARPPTRWRRSASPTRWDGTCRTRSGGRESRRLGAGRRQPATGGHAAGYPHRLLGRHQPFERRGRSRVVDRHRGDGHRWIQWQRPVPTLGEFQQDVANKRIGYYIAPSADEHRPGGFGGRLAHTDITKWVLANFAPIKVGPTPCTTSPRLRNDASPIE